jgi:hypothetical protein
MTCLDGVGSKDVVTKTAAFQLAYGEDLAGTLVGTLQAHRISVTVELFCSPVSDHFVVK